MIYCLHKKELVNKGLEINGVKNHLELQHVIYNVIKIQIRFGAYRFEDRLPTIEDASQYFLVSVRTIRTVYQHLASDGYITISKSIGVKVKVQYSEQEIETYVQQFLAEHKNSLLDLSRSMRLLFSKAQWLGLKSISSKQLDYLEQLSTQDENLSPYIVILQHQFIYGALGNDLLMRLVWQVFMFFLTPFFSVPGNLKYLTTEQESLLQMTQLCRDQNWELLRTSTEIYLEQKYHALRNFYKNRNLFSTSKQQIPFIWSSYQKASQICYSLGMELLIAINHGYYPPGTFLPSLKTLAKEKQVSINTVRRTFSLLNNIGVTRSINGVGTQVLPIEQIAEYCDLSQPTVRKRLFDYAKSLHILTLSCRQIVEATISSMDKNSIEKWKLKLTAIAQVHRHELVPYTILSLLSQDAPLTAVRTVYTELFQQLFWGHPLRGMLKDPQSYTSFYLPYFDFFLESLERFDAVGFASKFEELMEHEIKFAVDHLVSLGINEASALILDQ